MLTVSALHVLVSSPPASGALRLKRKRRRARQADVSDPISDADFSIGLPRAWMNRRLNAELIPTRGISERGTAKPLAMPAVAAGADLQFWLRHFHSCPQAVAVGDNS